MGSPQKNDNEVKIDYDYTFTPNIHELLIPRGPKPYSRSGHKIVCDDENMYCFGGSSSSSSRERSESNLCRELWRYTFSSMTWEQLEVKNIPTTVCSCALILVGKTLVVYGGTGYDNFDERSNDLYLCNLNTTDLNFRYVETNGVAPEKLYGQAIFNKDNYLYVVGGTTGFDFFCNIHRLNMKTHVWEEVYINRNQNKNEPSGRYRHELAVVKDKVYILGGSSGRRGFGYEELSVFDLQKSKWDIVTTIKDVHNGYPEPRQFFSSVNIPGTTSFIIFGGKGDDYRTLDCAWKFEISTLQWSKLSSLSLSTSVYFHSTCITPSGKIYTFSGVNRSREKLKKVPHLQTAWVGIPKLEDMALEAVVHYNLINKDNVTMLRKLGLPIRYANMFR